MDNYVMIKGNNRNGIIVVLDPNVDFKTLHEKVAERFKDSAKFLGNMKTAITFEGRVLSDSEQNDLIHAITDNSDLDILCVIDQSTGASLPLEQSVKAVVQAASNDTAKLFKGNLRSGQTLDLDCSIVVIGDVNAGASISSKGSIIVLGALKGNAFAGTDGNEHAFVLALDMEPVQIRIADSIARSPDSRDAIDAREPKIAILDDDRIYIEPVTRKVLADIKL